MAVTGFEKFFIGNQIDWVLKWVCGCQVFSKEIKSNAVSKLFILTWCYEDMKVLNLGYEKSYEKFPITVICDIFSNFPAVFHNTQVMKWHFPACDRNTDLHNLRDLLIHEWLSLFAHMYVLARNILSPRSCSLCSYVCIKWYELHLLSLGQKYSVSKVLFSLLICMYWPSRTSTPFQSEIFSLSSYMNKQLDRIFHFGRVC